MAGVICPATIIVGRLKIINTNYKCLPHGDNTGDTSIRKPANDFFFSYQCPPSALRLIILLPCQYNLPISLLNVTHYINMLLVVARDYVFFWTFKNPETCVAQFIIVTKLELPIFLVRIRRIINMGPNEQRSHRNIYNMIQCFPVQWRIISLSTISLTFYEFNLKKWQIFIQIRMGMEFLKILPQSMLMVYKVLTVNISSF